MTGTDEAGVAVVEPGVIRVPRLPRVGHPWRGPALACAVTVIGGLLLPVLLLRLWDADLAVPLSAAGDGPQTQMFAQGVIEAGWFLRNDRLGMPGGQELYDFPMADHLHFASIKVIGLAFPDAALAVNLFYLLTFPLVALTALYFLRQLGVGYPVAVVAALLYCCLPCHFLRGTSLSLIHI